jgi:hypothetical protein
MRLADQVVDEDGQIDRMMRPRAQPEVRQPAQDPIQRLHRSAEISSSAARARTARRGGRWIPRCWRTRWPPRTP